ncbi:dual specificity phosphatase, catalytic domain-containing protein, putative, partial [Eimeria tenella]
VQLQYLQDRMEEVRPALPHSVEPEEQQQQQQQQQQKGAAAGAAAAYAFDATVSIEESEPDLFRRDPDARNRESANL